MLIAVRGAYRSAKIQKCRCFERREYGHWSKPPAASYPGGPGSSLEDGLLTRQRTRAGVDSRTSWILLQQRHQFGNRLYDICRLACVYCSFGRGPILPLRPNPDDVHAAAQGAIDVDIHLVADKQGLRRPNTHPLKCLIEYNRTS